MTFGEWFRGLVEEVERGDPGDEHRAVNNGQARSVDVKRETPAESPCRGRVLTRLTIICEEIDCR